MNKILLRMGITGLAGIILFNTIKSIKVHKQIKHYDGLINELENLDVDNLDQLKRVHDKLVITPLKTV